MDNVSDTYKNARDVLTLRNGDPVSKSAVQLSPQGLQLLHLIRMARTVITRTEDPTLQSLSEKWLRDLLSGISGLDIPLPKELSVFEAVRDEKSMTEINSTLSKHDVLRQLDEVIGLEPLKPKVVEPQVPEPFPLRALTQKGQPPLLFDE